jgi:DNA replication protein DnaC
VPFLVLDDIGTAQLTKWGQEKLWWVVNERDLHHRAEAPRTTVVTTNLTLPKLAAHLDEEGRTWDRIRGWATLIETTGRSQRGMDL